TMFPSPRPPPSPYTTLFRSLVHRLSLPVFPFALQSALQMVPLQTVSHPSIPLSALPARFHLPVLQMTLLWTAVPVVALLQIPRPHLLSFLQKVPRQMGFPGALHRSVPQQKLRLTLLLGILPHRRFYCLEGNRLPVPFPPDFHQSAPACHRWHLPWLLPHRPFLALPALSVIQKPLFPVLGLTLHPEFP